jgi:hypothetical protein
MSFEATLQRHRSTRAKPQRGDIFAIEVRDKGYVFGRVILNALPREQAPMPGVHLIYVYRCLTREKIPPREQLRPEWLLLPPLFTNSLGWSKGYFERIDSDTIGPKDVLPRHCFKRWDGKYLDEHGHIMNKAVEPCGEWALMSYRMIDDLVSEALGIPRAPV